MRYRHLLVVAVSTALLLGVTKTEGQMICGDADGSGSVAVTDGVAALRAAAGLSSECGVPTCDMDSDGTVSVSDGVSILRRAARLPAGAGCGTRFGDIIKIVQTDGAIGDLKLGMPPAPDPGAPHRITFIGGPTKVVSAGQASFSIEVDGDIEALVIALSEAGTVVQGFTELPVGAGVRTVDVRLAIARTAGVSDAVDLRFASRAAGAVSGFQTRTIEILDASAAIAGPVEFGGHIYLLLQAAGWTDSEAQAVALGGHLVTIDDQSENEWVLDTFAPLASGQGNLWLGLNDAAEEGSYTWISGEPVTFTAWSPGEPNNQNDEDYAHIAGTSFAGHARGSWNDIQETGLGGGGLVTIPHGVVEIEPE
jgi:hypothetical protein